MNDIGPLYKKDHPFKASARRHQSEYRVRELNVPYNEYGNRLRPEDARRLLIYYPELGVRESLRERFSNFSLKRDGDMLRSEHIPFNMFGPFSNNLDLGRRIIVSALNLPIATINKVEFEFAPPPKSCYLDDMTAFDFYMECTGTKGKRIGIGVEVKYTELSYPIGKKEKEFIDNMNSAYWVMTRSSGLFKNPMDKSIASNEIRQIWRNHLLGVSMVLRDELDQFISITLFPMGNTHFTNAIEQYRRRLLSEATTMVLPLTFERYIESIPNEYPYSKWKNYLYERYLV